MPKANIAPVGNITNPRRDLYRCVFFVKDNTHILAVLTFALRFKEKSYFLLTKQKNCDIINRLNFSMRTWRNWQTRWFQVPVKQFMWVQVPSSAPSKTAESSWLCHFLFFWILRKYILVCFSKKLNVILLHFLDIIFSYIIKTYGNTKLICNKYICKKLCIKLHRLHKELKN